MKKKKLEECGLKWCLDNGHALQITDEEEGEKEGNVGDLVSSKEAAMLSPKTNRMNNNARSPNHQKSDADVQPKQDGNNYESSSTSSPNNSRDRDHGEEKDQPCSRVATTAASFKNLKRKNQDAIWVRLGRTEHQAYELYDPNDNKSNCDEDGNITVWVEWVSTGKKGSCLENQINRNGLQARKRSRPNYLSS